MYSLNGEGDDMTIRRIAELVAKSSMLALVAFMLLVVGVDTRQWLPVNCGVATILALTGLCAAGVVISGAGTTSRKV
jgi:hypothetical protein